jgi:hypothetical protein
MGQRRTPWDKDRHGDPCLAATPMNVFPPAAVLTFFLEGGLSVFKDSRTYKDLCECIGQ